MADLTRCHHITFTLTGSAPRPDVPPEVYLIDRLYTVDNDRVTQSTTYQMVLDRMRRMAADDPNGRCNYVGSCAHCGAVWGGQTRKEYFDA